MAILSELDPTIENKDKLQKIIKCAIDACEKVHNKIELSLKEYDTGSNKLNDIEWEVKYYRMFVNLSP